MPPPNRVHIFGASGSGTTTLGEAFAANHGHRHFDTADFYWLPTDPPYRQKRLREARLALLRTSLAECSSDFLAWAGRYDTGGLDMRSRAFTKHGSRNYRSDGRPARVT